MYRNKSYHRTYIRRGMYTRLIFTNITLSLALISAPLTNSVFNTATEVLLLVAVVLLPHAYNSAILPCYKHHNKTMSNIP